MLFFRNGLSENKTEEAEKCNILPEIPSKESILKLTKEKESLETRVSLLKNTIERSISERKKLSKDEPSTITKQVIRKALCFTPFEDYTLPDVSSSNVKKVVLPLISMPSTDENFELVNRLPRQKTKEEAQDDKVIKKALNITNNKRFSLLKRRRLGAVNDELFKKRENELFSEFKLSETGIYAKKVQLKKNIKEGPFLSVYKGKHHESDCNKCKSFPENSNNSRKTALQSKLKRSLQLINYSQQNIQNSIFNLKNELPATEIKAKVFLKKYGSQHLKRLFLQIENSRVLKTLRKWKLVVDKISEAELQIAYSQAQGSVRFKRVHKAASQRRVNETFLVWNNIIKQLKQNEFGILCHKKSIIIQCFWRCCWAIQNVFKKREKKRKFLELQCVLKIQSIFRGKMERELFHIYLEQVNQQKAACLIQKNFRIFWFKQTIFKHIDKLRKEVAATEMLQRRVRQWQARKELEHKKYLRQTRKVTIIQSAIRVKEAKKELALLKLQKYRKVCLIKIQSCCRRFLALKVLQHRRELFVIEVKLKRRATIVIQKHIRGYLARKEKKRLIMVKIKEYEENERKIVLIQSIYRRIRDTKFVKKYKEELTEKYIILARDWVESYEAHRSRYLFFNLFTNEVLFEPPLQGYTDINGKLNLKDGRCIEDPKVEEEKRRLEELEKCIECEERPATRMCNDCQDVYCNECFVSVHCHGKLKIHTYKWFQDGQEEADNILPHDLQIEQEPNTVHSIETAWEEMFDESSQKTFWFNTLTEESTWYNPSIPQEVIEDYYPEANQSVQDSWEALIDETSGSSYWYNSITQETTWSNPGQEGAWEEYFDESSKTQFWYNSETNESTWEQPY